MGKSRKKIRISVRLKLGATFTVLIAGLILLLNTYPVISFRDLVFASKKSSMLSQAAVMTSALSALETLGSGDVESVMQLLDVTALTRVVVTDGAGLIVYDTSEADSGAGRYALFSEIATALRGESVFYSNYADGAFMSRAAMPIVAHGGIEGTVYLYDYDSQEAELISGLQGNIRNISLAVGAASFVAILFFTYTLTHRTRELLRAMRVVREGGYDYRVDVHGRDEISELGAEFNILTQRLETTEEARRRFVSDASHELRTPLASIRLLSDSIAQTDEMDLTTMREFASDIGSEAERLQRTTEKLLSLTRLDARVHAERRAVSVRAVAENTLRLLRPLAEKQSVSIEYKLSGDCIIYSSEDEIYQIIFNLVENGIKYNRPGGSVELELRSENGWAVATVSDTGIGIPEEDLANIFSRFYRVDKARSRASGGSGLGLSIVHDTVVSNGGSVEAARREPCGTRFTVRFPLYLGGEARS